MKWGIYEPEDRPIQVAPCDEEGNTAHFLYEDCICGQHFELSAAGYIIVHEDVL
jgi:hypothetical protein